MTAPAPVHQEAAARAMSTLVLAFAADPVERFLYPEAEQYDHWYEHAP